MSNDNLDINLDRMSLEHDAEHARHREQHAQFRQRRHAQNIHPLYNCNIDTFNPDDDVRIEQHNIGPMDFECEYCHALGYEDERKKTNGVYHLGKLCCNQGKVNLPEQPAFPIGLYKYFTENTQEAKHFRKMIRWFNSGMAMGSIQITDATVYRRGPAAFKVAGQMYKRVGPMQASHIGNDTTAKCLQIYFLDPDEQAELRVGRQYSTVRSAATREREAETFTQLLHILRSCGNPLLNSYYTIHEQVEAMDIRPEEIRIAIDTKPQDDRHPGRYNSPTCTEISMLLPDESVEHLSKNAIIMPMRQADANENPIRIIPDHHPSHDAYLYPLLYPRGEDGWHRGLRSQNDRTRKISARDYARYNMMVRERHVVDPDDESRTIQDQNPRQMSGKLWQQWLCDMWAKVESNDLGYLENNQDKLYADNYQKVKKRKAEGTTGKGPPTVLPSTYKQSDRYMHRKLQDALALARVFGKPHLFITFTFDVFCDEIKQHLQPGQTPYDRPDIIARVYWQNYKEFINDIEKKHLFGNCIARVSVVEFQKRGAPHTHTLIWIEGYENASPADIDKIISAEIPARGEEGTAQRELFNLVTTKMMHGPCSFGWPCWEDDSCGKHFPKEFTTTTVIESHGNYPLYRRRSPEDGGNTATSSNGTLLDNRWVVPYNAQLLLKYRSHINVEYVVSVASIKYLFKYNMKGGDLLTVGMADDDNDITNYLTKRYISSVSAAWNLFGFHMQEIVPPVYQQSIHLPDRQRTVYHDTDKGVEEAIRTSEHTMLTEFFLANEYCRDGIAGYENVSNILYEDMPAQYTWNGKMWCPRVNKAKLGNVCAVGRMPLLTPNYGDVFYLRVLLKHRTGIASFDELRTVDGDMKSTFYAACIALHLIDNDTMWFDCLEEAEQCKMPRALRDLFAVIVYHGKPQDVPGLYKKFEDAMLQDYERHYVKSGTGTVAAHNLAKNDLLKYLDNFFQHYQQSNEDYGLQAPEEKLHASDEYDPFAEEYYNKNIEFIQSNEEQRVFFKDMQDRIDNDTGGFFGLDAPAGTGKSFVINLILAYIRKDNDVGIGCAISGIASTIIRLGTTFHKRFHPPKFPKDVDICKLALDSEEAQIISKAKFIAIDEASMMHKELLDCLDKFLQRLMNSEEPFGGKLVVIIFDLRQLPPVVPGAGRPGIAIKSIKNSRAWQHIKIYHLKRNMRVERLIQRTTDPHHIHEMEWFADWLLKIGDGSRDITIGVGTEVERRSLIELPAHMVCCTPHDLQQKVYPNFAAEYTNNTYLAQRAILACTNDLIQQRNNEMVESIPGEATESISINYFVNAEDNKHYDISELEKMEVSGLPPHRLLLKKNVCVILLRSIHPTKGFCNGRRCLLVDIRNNILVLRPLESENDDRHIFVPRIPMECTQSRLGVPFMRRQYPILLAYYLTINRSQGQTLDVVGLELPTSVFMHGHTYVGCGRTGDPYGLHIYSNQEEFQDIRAQYLQDGVTYIKNEVWPELLLNE